MGGFFFFVIDYLDILQRAVSVRRNNLLMMSCAWEWRAIGSRRLEIAPSVDRNEMRQIADKPGAFARFGLVPCAAILPWALIQVSATVEVTSRLAGAKIKRARFRDIARWLFLDLGGYLGFICGSC